MNPTLLALIATCCVIAAAAGLWIMRSERGDKGRLERPPLVEKTDLHGRNRIIDRWVYLALELCRCDGAIDETEIAAIEVSLGREPIAVKREEAANMVHRALRATIRQSQIGGAIEEIARHADQVHRAWVVDGLAAIAEADGTVNREERLFLDRVRQELGV